MKKPPLFFICLLSLLFLPSEAYPVIKEVSVLLDNGILQGSISGTGMRLSGADGKEAVLSGTHNIEKRTGTEISAGGHTFRMPLKISSDGPMKYNGTPYNGTFIFKNSANGFKVSNLIDIENYLRGVIKAEMDPSWPFEALKAQVILARTFAVVSGGKHGDDDLCDSWHCQVYKGISAHDNIADRAVHETSGLILRWKGTPASVYYHSDSGGMVTSPANVWGGDTPYLKPKTEPFAYSGRNTTWEVALSLSAVRSKLEAGGINVGDLISVTPLKRDETGRILSMEVRGSSGTKVISGYKFRNIMGAGTVKSTLFEFGSRSPYINEQRGSFPSAPAASKPLNRAKPAEASEKIDLSEMPDDKEEKIIWLTKKRVFTTLELMEILSRPDDIDSYIEKGIARAEGRLPMPDFPAETSGDDGGAGHEALQVPEIRYVPRLSMAPATGLTVKIFGRGSGHGVGLSQIGAKTMAEKGWTYAQILDYYFPGTTIGQ